MQWTLGELARRSEVPARTVRYYADRGLIRPARRSAGGYRLFDEGGLRQLRFIRRLQGLGLSLRELQQVMRAAERQSCGDSSAAVRKRLEAHVSLVAERIAELERVRHELASLMDLQVRGCTDELCLCNGGRTERGSGRRAG